MSDSRHSLSQVDSTTALRVRKQPQVGDVLDGIYRLDAPLGKGGVGVVYRAFHLHLQRPCAIKFMHPQLVSNPELRTRFRREAQSAFQLGHPHIVAITDFRDDPNAWPYLVMELVVGETLRDRLDRGPLPPQLSLRIMIELCDALSAAHRRGVIHRDLKPENLFLTRVQSPGPGELDVTLKVLDFGLSKLLDGVEITGSGRLLGSPSYMSPEQARGDSHLVDVRSDIFAVGALLYECLTDEKMFNAERFEAKRQSIVAAKLPPLRFAERGMPLIDKIIARTCALKPDERYQTAAALQDALKQAEKALDDKSIAMATASALVVPVVAPVLTQQKLPPNGDSPSTAVSVSGGELISTREVARRRRTGLWLFAVSASVAAMGLGGFAGYSAWRTFAAPPSAVTVPRERTTTTPRENVPVVTAMVNGVNAKPVNAVVSPLEAPKPGTSAETAEPTVKPAALVVDSSGKPVEPDQATKPSEVLPAAELPAAPKAVSARNVPPLRVEPAEVAAPPTAPALLPGGKWKRGRIGPSKPIAFATASTPAAPVGKAGTSLMDLVHQANDILRRAAPAIKHCYPESVPPPAKISVDVTVQADGRVSEANVDGADDSGDCVLRVIRGLRFPQPTDSDSYGTRFDFVNLRR